MCQCLYARVWVRVNVRVNVVTSGDCISTCLFWFKQMQACKNTFVMRKTKGKIAELQKESQECEFLMKTFCLNPSRETYKRISQCPSVVRGDNYKLWSNMVPYWCVVDSADGAKDGTKDGADGAKAEGYNAKRTLVYDLIYKKAEAAPTAAIARQLLYIFAATGWFPAIEKFYECMGDTRIGMNSRIELCAEYKETRDLYCEKIREYIVADKDHFKKRGITVENVDFSQFDVYQKAYEEKKAAKK